MSKLKVISLWAGPGAGKSTLAASLFARMKRLRFSVELVTEVAKDLTYEKSWKRLSNQLQVLSKQNFRLARLEDEVEYAITDSPLPLSLVYSPPEQLTWIEPLVDQLWAQYENYPFFLRRTTAPYQEFGRNQTAEEARQLDDKIYQIFVMYGDSRALNPELPDVEDTIIRELNHRRAISNA